MSKDQSLATEVVTYFERSHKWLNGPWWVRYGKASNDGYSIGNIYEWNDVVEIRVDEPKESEINEFQKQTEIWYNIGLGNLSNTTRTCLEFLMSRDRAMAAELDEIKTRIDNEIVLFDNSNDTKE
jgi:hypothetical protein